jgi:transaldolase/glucose-6-phosphate isomerase
MNVLKQLTKCGQSIWLDYIRRKFITSGELQKLIKNKYVTGITSNPSIFEKAISGSVDYNDSIKKLAKKKLKAEEIVEKIIVEDIKSAAALLRPVFNKTKGDDGFVSIEVPPLLAHKTELTIKEASKLFKLINLPNVMVKIPGTEEGYEAIEESLYNGININITLLFSLKQYEKVVNAYFSALERRLKEKKRIDNISSVASIFVSRIDTLVDSKLDKLIQTEDNKDKKNLLRGLKGKFGIANSKIIYDNYKKLFSSSRFKELEKRGAKKQKVLWASTSTKNPEYSSIMYVQELIGAGTINTLTVDTLNEYEETGNPILTVEQNIQKAYEIKEQIEKSGIDIDEVMSRLEDEGVEKFEKSFDELYYCVESKRRSIIQKSYEKQKLSLGKYAGKIEKTAKKLGKEGFVKKLWSKDPSLWKNGEHADVIKNRLGWLKIFGMIRANASSVMALAVKLREEEYHHAVLLGMGGSSLCPEVYLKTFGIKYGYLNMFVLDSTDPSAIEYVETSIDIRNTIFIVSSKSGGTLETSTLFSYFYEKVKKEKGERAGENFIAITDPGTSLEKLAGEKHFRFTFINPPDIGGRYSALSYFGAVPAALMGIDIFTINERGERMAHACDACVDINDNPGAQLGITIAELAKSGRDKLTFLISREVSAFGSWVEQLVAESTGKDNTGIIPVDGEEIFDVNNFSNDRVFVYLKFGNNGDLLSSKISQLKRAGHPVIQIQVDDEWEIGGEFFRWEFAIACAGALLGIDPFDEPNVKESKDNTNKVLDDYKKNNTLSLPAPVLAKGNISFYFDKKILNLPKAGNIREYFKEYFKLAGKHDYAAITAFIPQSEKTTSLLENLRTVIRQNTKLATTLGFGPRFLHSTGQLHKGGPNSFFGLQITADDPFDLEIPGKEYSFGILKRAQALGDLQSLLRHERRVVNIHIKGDISAGLNELYEIIKDSFTL